MNKPLLRLLSLDEAPRVRRRPFDLATCAAAADILRDIEIRGERAVREHAARLGDLPEGRPCVHDRASLAAALDRIPSQDRGVLERAASRIRAFALAQRACLADLDVPVEGGRAGHACLPVHTAGCYAPGGRSPLPSSALMTAITARAAGVAEVWIASPRPTDATLAAAALAEADGLLTLGGVQAIGALAFGLCGVPACDMIVGPGNRWVTAAKHLVSDRVGIDMLAGPSELMVLADESADPALVAADLLAQAEHDDDAVPMLVATDPLLPERVEHHLRAMLATLPTRATAIRALDNGFAVVAPDLEAALAVCDAVAPEHLEVLTTHARETADRIHNAGVIFIGSSSAEVFGDYGAGPNHTLPTGGTARFRGGLSALTFLRPRAWLWIDPGKSAGSLVRDTEAFARMESLEAHARAASRRYPGRLPAQPMAMGGLEPPT